MRVGRVRSGLVTHSDWELLLPACRARCKHTRMNIQRGWAPLEGGFVSLTVCLLSYWCLDPMYTMYMSYASGVGLSAETVASFAVAVVAS